MNTPSIGYGTEVCAGCAHPNCVPADVVASMREHGISRPIENLTDPRLRYPEMLIMQGWERETAGEISCYHKSGEGCSQTVEFGEGRWRRVVSDLGERRHTVEMGPTGRSRQWIESARLPELNESLARERAFFDAFQASQPLPGQPQSVPAPAELAQSYRDRLDRLERVDESPADQAAGCPGEVVLEDTQARFWETPCGWELSELDRQDGKLHQARAFGAEIWAVESAPGEPPRAFYLNLEEPERSFSLA